MDVAAVSGSQGRANIACRRISWIQVLRDKKLSAQKGGGLDTPNGPRSLFPEVCLIAEPQKGVPQTNWWKMSAERVFATEFACTRNPENRRK